jgi:hypothetical protein
MLAMSIDPECTSYYGRMLLVMGKESSERDGNEALGQEKHVSNFLIGRQHT